MARKKADGTPNKSAIVKQVCRSCHQNRALSHYWKTNNVLYQGKDGTFDICKDCVRKTVVEEDGTINTQNFCDILAMMNRPYIPSVWKESCNEAEKRRSKGDTSGFADPLSIYMRRITAKKVQYIPMGYNDLEDSAQVKQRELDYAQKSMSDSKVTGLPSPITNSTTIAQIADEERIASDKYLKDNFSNFKVTDEMRNMFGLGFTIQEYSLMDRKYQSLAKSYPIKTEMHKEALINYVKYKVKEEIAISDNDVVAADKWSTMATKAADNAKLNPKQLSSADLQGGLSSFSEIFEAVEGASDVIKILPRFRQQPNDMVDFVIYEYVNYERELSNLPPISYEEVYAFYDRKKEEYLKEHGDPFGIFTDDKTQDETNRETIKRFITVQEDGDEE